MGDCSRSSTSGGLEFLEKGMGDGERGQGDKGTRETRVGFLPKSLKSRFFVNFEDNLYTANRLSL